MLEDSSFWTAVGFVIFVALVLAKGMPAIRAAIDARIARIGDRITQVNTICEEATALLHDCRAELTKYEETAKAALDAAQDEHDRILDAGKQKTADLAQQYEQLTQQKIARLSDAATQSVRHLAINRAVATAEIVLIDTMKNDADTYTDQAITDLSKSLQS